MKLALGMVVVLGLALSACSHGGTTDGCGPAARTMATVPPDARAFPSPAGLSVIGVEHKEPVTEIIGAVEADVGQVFQGYRQALAGGGYLVTNPTQGSDSAQMEFSGSSSIGTIHLVRECPGRTDVTVSITVAAGPA